MKKRSKLYFAVTNLISATDWSKDRSARYITNMDFDALLQGVNYFKEPVYQYQINNSFEPNCTYCGLQLLPCPATLIFRRPRRSRGDPVRISRYDELWILEDFSFALACSVETDYPNSDSGSLTTAYRVLRSTDLSLIAELIKSDMDIITEKLSEIAASYLDGPLPTYEL